MAGNSKVKLKLLYLMKIFHEKTDEDHPLTIKDLITCLKRYGVVAERKSIYTDIALLNEYGMEILVDSEKGNANHYFLAGREFELPELKLLIDAVQASRFITQHKTEKLIKKIQSLTSIHEAKGLQRQVTVQNRVKASNERIYINVDKLHESIQKGKQIQFKYLQYTIDKQQSFKRGGELYTMSPYALAWANENYYLVGYYERYQTITNFRVDRMSHIQLLENDIVVPDEFKQFNIVDYMNKSFGMFAGNEEWVEMEFDNSLINAVIDQFGQAVKVSTNNEQTFRIEVQVAVTPTLLGWLFMFGDKVKIISPPSCVEKMQQAVQAVADRY